MKNIAIVTGASSGMGKRFAETLLEHIDVDEMWVISRKEENLKSLSERISIPLKFFELDLTKESSFDKISENLKEEKINIKILINASGYGKFEACENISIEDNIGMIRLNCEALTKLCLISIPYMSSGSNIINIASVAAFQPVPYIGVYAASKAYVLSFSRSLNRELKSKNIHVLALCPFWTKTNFFQRAVTNKKIVKKYVAMYEANDVVNNCWKDLKKKKDISLYGFISKGQVFLCKILPHKLVMNIWIKQQKL